MKCTKLFALLLVAVLVSVCAVSSVLPVTAEEIDIDDYYYFLPFTTVGEALQEDDLIDRIEDEDGIKDDTALIVTGDVVFSESITYAAVVMGDAVPDGDVTALDYFEVKKHALKVSALEYMNFLAADVNFDGEVTALDYFLIKKHYFKVATLELPTNVDSIAVILYHHIVSDEAKLTNQWKNNDVTISVSDFRRTLDIIEDSGANVITIEELVAYVKGEKRIPKKSVVICFDDGYRSNTHYATDILREYGYKSSIFTIFEWSDIDNTDISYTDTVLQHFDFSEMEDCSDVFTYHGHTYSNHNHLSEQSYNQIYDDLMLSQNLYEARFFAYPYGDYNKTVIDAVKAAGYEAAFTTETRRADPFDDPYEIPRFSITPNLSESTILGWIG